MNTTPLMLYSIVIVICMGCNMSTSTQLNSITQPLSASTPASIVSEKDLVKNLGLVNVESIIFDQHHSVFYVTSGVDYKTGKDGFISKISERGELIKLRWIVDLNRPTGMAMYKDRLYVADVNSLLVIDTHDGKILKKFKEPIPNSGLNDVTINLNGDVFVSASFVNSVFRLNRENESLELWVRDDTKLKYANGLLANNDHVMVAGLELSRVDIKTKNIRSVNMSPKVQDFDGITEDGSGGYLLTTVENSALWQLKAEQITLLKQDGNYFGDLTFLENKNKLYIPRGKTATGVFFISEYILE